MLMISLRQPTASWIACKWQTILSSGTERAVYRFLEGKQFAIHASEDEFDNAAFKAGKPFLSKEQVELTEYFREVSGLVCVATCYLHRPIWRKESSAALIACTKWRNGAFLRDVRHYQAQPIVPQMYINETGIIKDGDMRGAYVPGLDLPNIRDLGKWYEKPIQRIP